MRDPNVSPSLMKTVAPGKLPRTSNSAVSVERALKAREKWARGWKVSVS